MTIDRAGANPSSCRASGNNERKKQKSDMICARKVSGHWRIIRYTGIVTPMQNTINPQVIHALLSDASGSVLLVRRRDALLLSLPKGDVRGSESLIDLLTTFCTRQVGTAPDFVGSVTEFTLAGKRVGIGFSEIPHARADARKKIETVFWMRPEKLPPEVDPIARYTIALHSQRIVR
ncbi:MAG TPA: hypothetical protein VGA56_23500, partial [Opitutaceae bacterium]